MAAVCRRGWQQEEASNGKRTDHLDDWAEPKVPLTDGMAPGVVDEDEGVNNS